MNANTTRTGQQNEERKYKRMVDINDDNHETFRVAA